MKELCQIVGLSALLVHVPMAGEAAAIYQNDFSGTGTPGSIRVTQGFSDYSQVWSSASSLIPVAGNQCARYDITIPSLPASTGVRWYGGFYAYAGALTTLPAQWQFSFDMSVEIVEPFRVDVIVNDGSTLPPGISSTRTYWVQPSEIGWNHIVIDQNTSGSLSQLFFNPAPGTYLTVCLSSHDASSNPLSLSQIGTHEFLLDNVTLQSVPEPGALTFVGLSGVLILTMRRRRMISVPEVAHPEADMSPTS